MLAGHAPPLLFLVLGQLGPRPLRLVRRFTGAAGVMPQFRVQLRVCELEPGIFLSHYRSPSQGM